MSMLVKIKSIFSPKVLPAESSSSSVALAEEKRQMALAVAQGVSQGVIAVLESKQFREALEGATRLNGVQNIGTIGNGAPIISLKGRSAVFLSLI